MKKRVRAILAILLATVVCFIGISAEQIARAADYTIILDEKKNVGANASTTHKFYLSKSSTVMIEFDVNTQVNLSYTVKDMASGEQVTYKCNSNEWMVSNKGSGYYTSRSLNMGYGYYEVTAKFDQAVSYELVVYTEQGTATTPTTTTQPTPTTTTAPSTTTTTPSLKMSSSKLTMVEGSSKKLSVKNASGKVKWKSSKSSVAKVNTKGKVTAKKAGKAIISATCKGKTVRCSVVVKKNVYTYTKPTTSNTTYGTVTFGVYHATYNKSGDLVCKMRVVNRTPYKVTKIKYIVKACTAKGKLIGKKAKAKNITIASGSSKTITVTIPKSKLKKKSANLREAVIDVDEPHVLRLRKIII